MFISTASEALFSVLAVGCCMAKATAAEALSRSSSLPGLANKSSSLEEETVLDELISF